MKIECLKDMREAFVKIEKLSELKRVKVVFRDGSKCSAIKAGNNGTRLQTWNYKTHEWDGFPVTCSLIKEIIF